MGIWRWRLRRSLFRMVMTMARLLTRVESGDSLLYPQVNGDSSSWWLGTTKTQFVMFGIIMHVINELHLSISNSTCTYFYNFSIFNPAKLPNQAILAHLGDFFCPTGDWERWISWKDLGGPRGAPNFTVGKFSIMPLVDGFGWWGCCDVPLNLAQGSLLFYMHVYIFFFVVVGKVGKDIIFRWFLPVTIICMTSTIFACDTWPATCLRHPMPVASVPWNSSAASASETEKVLSKHVAGETGFQTFMGFDGIHGILPKEHHQRTWKLNMFFFPLESQLF